MSNSVLRLIRSDIRRKQEHYVLVDRFFNKYVKIGLQLGTLAVVAYRVGHWAYSLSGPLKFLAVFGYQLFSLPIRWASRIQIDPHVPIGEGFVIHNFSSIFINAERIGINFTVNQSVTVGHDWSRRGLPVLGNNLFLGSGAKVLGNVQIGDDVVVAANCLVTRSIASNTLVAGVPAIVVSRGIQGDYVKTVAAKRN